MMSQTILRPDGTTLTYDRFVPEKPGFPAGVMFMHGFKADLNGTKAAFLADACRRLGIAFIRYNAFAHGESPDNGSWADFTISRAVHDALFVLDELTTGPQIVMGSSMGGWVALRLLEERPDRIAGMIGIATAPDFTKKLGAPNGDYTQNLINDGPNNFVMNEEWNFTGPVHLIQGKLDDSVPWQTAQKIAAKFPIPAKVTLIDDGDHRLNRDQDLKLQENAILDMMKYV